MPHAYWQKSTVVYVLFLLYTEYLQQLQWRAEVKTVNEEKEM